MNQDPNWERQLLEKLATAALVEQRRARQWKIFFRLIWLLLIGLLISAIWSARHEETRLSALADGKHTALIELQGPIDSENDSANKLVQGLEHAFDDSGTRGIVVRANSPGGSPVLSGEAYDELLRLRKLHPGVPVVFVVEDMCASGCYYIASASDKIYADKASLVGSIGVISAGFGFTGVMDKLGIQRRLMTAGSNKAMGDPFSPQNPAHEAIKRELIDGIDRQFVKAVKNGRGARLKNDPELFSGRVWLGDEAVALGLADGLGSVRSVARDVIGAPELVDYTQEEDFPSRVARHLGVEFFGAVKSVFSPRFF